MHQLFTGGSRFQRIVFVFAFAIACAVAGFRLATTTASCLLDITTTGADGKQPLDGCLELYSLIGSKSLFNFEGGHLRIRVPGCSWYRVRATAPGHTVSWRSVWCPPGRVKCSLALGIDTPAWENGVFVESGTSDPQIFWCHLNDIDTISPAVFLTHGQNLHLIHGLEACWIARNKSVDGTGIYSLRFDGSQYQDDGDLPVPAEGEDANTSCDAYAVSSTGEIAFLSMDREREDLYTIRVNADTIWYASSPSEHIGMHAIYWLNANELVVVTNQAIYACRRRSETWQPALCLTPRESSLCGRTLIDRHNYSIYYVAKPNAGGSLSLHAVIGGEDHLLTSEPDRLELMSVVGNDEQESLCFLTSTGVKRVVIRGKTPGSIALLCGPDTSPTSLTAVYASSFRDGIIWLTPQKTFWGYTAEGECARIANLADDAEDIAATWIAPHALLIRAKLSGAYRTWMVHPRNRCNRIQLLPHDMGTLPIAGQHQAAYLPRKRIAAIVTNNCDLWLLDAAVSPAPTMQQIRDIPNCRAVYTYCSQKEE